MTPPPRAAYVYVLLGLVASAAAQPLPAAAGPTPTLPANTDALDAVVRRLEGELASVQGDVAQLQARSQDVRTQNQAFEGEVAELRATQRGFQDEVAQLRAENRDFKARLRALEMNATGTSAPRRRVEEDLVGGEYVVQHFADVVPASGGLGTSGNGCATCGGHRRMQAGGYGDGGAQMSSDQPVFTVNSGPCTLETSGSVVCVGRPSGYTDSESCQITSSSAGTLSSCPVFVTEAGCKCRFLLPPALPYAHPLPRRLTLCCYVCR